MVKYSHTSFVTSAPFESWRLTAAEAMQIREASDRTQRPRGQAVCRLRESSRTGELPAACQSWGGPRRQPSQKCSQKSFSKYWLIGCCSRKMPPSIPTGDGSKGYYHLNGSSAIVEDGFSFPKHFVWSRGGKEKRSFGWQSKEHDQLFLQNGKESQSFRTLSERSMASGWHLQRREEKHPLYIIHNNMSARITRAAYPGGGEQKGIQFCMHGQDSCERPNWEFHIMNTALCQTVTMRTISVCYIEYLQTGSELVFHRTMGNSHRCLVFSGLNVACVCTAIISQPNQCKVKLITSVSMSDNLKQFNMQEKTYHCCIVI